jgi:uncharacterized protein YjeT (DUF2065 family)
MATSLIIGKILGTYLFIVGIAILMDSSYYKKILNNKVQSSFLLVLSGIMTLIIGLIMVIFHNLWNQSWEIVITIIAWITVLKGIFILFFPKIALKLMKDFSKKTLLWSGWICMIVGAYLMYMSFFYIY